MMNVRTQFLRFSGVGVVGTGVHYLVLIVLVQAMKIDPVVASSIGAIAGAIVNYRLNYTFTFNSDKPHHDAMTKFFVVAGTGLLINAALMELFTGLMAWHYLIAQIVTTLLVLLCTFTGNRYWTFGRY